MRLFTKFFLFGMLILGVAFSVSGYFLLHYSLESSLAREADFALMQYQYDKFTVQSAFLTYSDVSVVVSYTREGIALKDGDVYTVWQVSPEGISSRKEGDTQGREGTAKGQQSIPSGDGDSAQAPAQDMENLSLLLTLAGEIGVPVAFYGEDMEPLYSEIDRVDRSFLEGLSAGAHAYRFQEEPGGSAVLVGSVLDWKGTSVRFVTQWDISKTMAQQDTLRQYFLRCYLAAMAAGMVLLGFLSAMLTRPLKRMAKGARRMAGGNYKERFGAPGRDEIGELACSFNQMADAVEEKIGELEKAAREKEDFVANFAHELKTPLTSIIGYADTIYQKELTREETRQASWNIWNEGMRLEALSWKLMELTVLRRQDFPLEEMSAEELLQDVTEGLEPLFARNQISFRLQVDPAYVRVDYDLLKTLLMNLCDNACKAGASRIELTGRVEAGQTNVSHGQKGRAGVTTGYTGEERQDPIDLGEQRPGSCGGEKYWISIADNGCGMEEGELARITEAFYMVDKARSRKQHGAGLGLTLADQIARIHGSRLFFESRKGQGTRVRFCLDCEEDLWEKETCTAEDIEMTREAGQGKEETDSGRGKRQEQGKGQEEDNV